MSQSQAEPRNIERGFCACLTQPRLLSSFLGCLDFSRDQIMVCAAFPDRIKFSVEESKSMQGVVELPSNFFADYLVSCPEGTEDEDMRVTFRIQLQTFHDCLRLFGDLSGRVTLEYTTAEKLLCIALEDRSQTMAMNTTFRLQTMDDNSPPSDYHFVDHPCHHMVLMKAEDLKDALHELEWIGGASTEMIMSDEEPYFAITTVGDCGDATVEFPQDSDVFSHFECDKELVVEYQTSRLQNAKAALGVANDVQVRINQEGVLDIECLKKTNDADIYIRFQLYPTMSYE